jgi:hypothetical protein
MLALGALLPTKTARRSRQEQCIHSREPSAMIAAVTAKLMRDARQVHYCTLVRLGRESSYIACPSEGHVYGRGDGDEPQHFSLGTPSKVFCVLISTRIYAPDFLHKALQPRRWHLATSNIPQSPSPLADRFAVDVLGGAANEGRKWIRTIMGWEATEYERVP